MKKKGVKKEGKEYKPSLSGAIKDLDNEINELQKDKSLLHRQLKDVSSSLNVDNEKENKLQGEIAKLIQKEAKLNQKRKILESKIDNVSEKLNKISKIKSEISDI